MAATVLCASAAKSDKTHTHPETAEQERKQTLSTKRGPGGSARLPRLAAHGGLPGPGSHRLPLRKPCQGGWGPGAEEEMTARGQRTRRRAHPSSSPAAPTREPVSCLRRSPRAPADTCPPTRPSCSLLLLHSPCHSPVSGCPRLCHLLGEHRQTENTCGCTHDLVIPKLCGFRRIASALSTPTPSANRDNSAGSLSRHPAPRG